MNTADKIAEILSELQNSDASKERTKKRRRKEATWKYSIRKKARNAGKECASSRNTVIRARQIKMPCNDTCKLKCFEKFSPEERQSILRAFWDKKVDYDRKRQFVATNIDILPVAK